MDTVVELTTGFTLHHSVLQEYYLSNLQMQLITRIKFLIRLF